MIVLNQFRLMNFLSAIDLNRKVGVRQLAQIRQWSPRILIKNKFQLYAERRKRRRYN